MMLIRLAVLVLCTLPALFAADTIPSGQAKDHIGETGTVCGHVADARYIESGSHVTFLNFDNRYPNHTFTAFVRADGRSKVGTPEKDYKDKDICVTGRIQEYGGKPEIMVTDPQQLRPR